MNGVGLIYLNKANDTAYPEKGKYINFMDF